MPNTVDRRIVEMRFDNKDFEQNIGSTLISLETLKKALEMNGAGAGMEKVNEAAKKVDLSNVQNSAEQATRSFSTMEVVAITALANITNSAVNAGKKLIGSFIDPLLGGGKQRAMNMEQANFMFGGLGYAAEKIGGVGKTGSIMDNLYKSVEGTFYSLDRAALVGSQLMAAGIKGTEKEFVDYMKGIAGVASVYSADYQRVGEIFAEVAATGHLTGRQIESFRAMSVPTFEILAKYLQKTEGGAKKTNEEIQKMVSDGKIGFKTFAKAMDDAFGSQAQKSKQLFTGAVEDMRAAMARIGEKLWKPLVGSGGLGVQFFNAMVPLIDNVNSRLTPAFELWAAAIHKVSDNLMPVIDAIGAIFDYDNTLNELMRLSDESLKDVNGNYLVDPKRVKILEKNKELIDKIRSSLSAVITPVRQFAHLLRQMFKSDEVTTKIKQFAYSMGITQKQLEHMSRTITMLKNAGRILKGTFDVIKDLFSEGMGSKARMLAYSMGLTNKELEYLNDIVTGLKSTFSIFKNVVTTVIDTVVHGIFNIGNEASTHVSFFRGLFDLILSALAAIGRFLTNLEEPVASLLALSKEFVGGVFGIFRDLGDNLSKIGSGALEALDGLSISLGNFGEKAIPVIKQLLAFGSGAINAVFDALFGVFGGLGGLIRGIVKGVSIAGLYNILKAIMHFFRTLYEGGIFGNLGLGEAFNETRLALIGLQNSLKVMQNTLKAGALLLISSAILELVIALKILAAIDAAKLTTASIAIGALFNMLVASTLHMKPVNVSGIIRLAAAIRIIAGAVKELGELSLGSLAKGLGGVAVLLYVLTDIAKRLTVLNIAVADTKIKRGALMPIVTAILGISLAVKMLVKPIQTLGSMDLKSLAKGIGSVAILLGGLVGAIILLANKLNMSQAAGGFLNNFVGARGQLYTMAALLIMIAAAINMMIRPVKQFGSMDIESLEKGLSSVAILFAEIAAFIAVFNAIKIENTKSLLSLGASMIMIAAAVNLLAKPVIALGKIDSKKMLQGLLSLAAILGEVAIFLAAIKIAELEPGQLLASAATLLIVAAAIAIIGQALEQISAIQNVGQGLAAIFGALLILGVAMYAMRECLPGAAAMIVVAGALAILAPALALLSTINFKGVAAGLLMLGGALAMLIGAGALMVIQPEIAAGMIALAGAVALLGLGVLGLGAGLTLLAAAFVTGIQPIMDGLLQLSTIIPAIAENLAKGFLVFIEIVAQNVDVLIQLFKTIFSALIESATEYVPQLVGLGVMVVTTILTAIRDNIGPFTEMGIQIVINFMNGLAAKQHEATDAAANLIISSLNACADAIAEHGPELIAAIQSIILAALEVLASAIPGFGKYAAKAIEKYRKELDTGGKKASKTAKKTAKEVEKNLKVDADGKVTKEHKKTFDNMSKAVDDGGKKASKKAKNAADDVDKNLKIKDQTSNGRNAVAGIVSGMNSQVGALQAKSNQIADIVDRTIRLKNQIKSPSRRLAKTGRFLMLGLINGLDSLKADYQNRANNISTTLLTSANAAVHSMDSFTIPNLNSTITRASEVNVRMKGVERENAKLYDGIHSLTNKLDSMTETMNSRSLNVYNNIDGSTDPDAFAEGLIRSFRLNARTV